MRHLGGGLLLLSLTLPLSQCEKQVSYPLDGFNFTDIGSYMLLAAYIWPILTNFTRISLKSPKKQLATAVFEALFCVASGWLILCLASIGDRILIGGYVAFTGLFIYLSASIAEIWSLWRECRALRPPDHPI